MAGPEGGAPSGGQGFLGVVGAVFAAATAVFFAVGEFLTSDRSLNSFFRQGMDEVGVATKAFPDSIQVDESGTLWNPTQGEIAQTGKSRDRENVWRAGDYPTPGEIAASNDRSGRDNDQGREHDQDLSY